jgi:hypothetical protein
MPVEWVQQYSHITPTIESDLLLDYSFPKQTNSKLSTVLVEGELQTRRLKTVLRSTGDFLEYETRRAE